MNSSIELAHKRVDIDRSGFVYDSICDDLPHASLLKNNKIFDNVKSGEDLYFVHFTPHLDTIRSSGHILSSPGGLGEALYTIPLYRVSQDTFDLDNFSSLVLSHTSNAGATLMPVIAKLPAAKQAVLHGLNYLQMGMLLYEIAAANNQYEGALLRARAKAKVMLDSDDWRLASGSDETGAFNAISSLAEKESIFAMMYYEAVSQVLLLSSSDDRTNDLERKGELNSALFYEPLRQYKEIKTRRFDANVFKPSHDELIDLVKRLEELGMVQVDLRMFMRRCAKNITTVLKASLKSADGDQAKPLAGQIFYGEIMRVGNLEDKRLIRLALAEEQSQLWAKTGNYFVSNATTFKQEIGVIPFNSPVEFYLGEINSNARTIKLGDRIQIKLKGPLNNV